MKNVLKVFSLLLFFAVNAFASVHDDLILLKKLFQEKNFYKAKELAEQLLKDPSASFYSNLILSDIEFLEGNLFASKHRIESLMEKHPDKLELLKKRLEKIEKEEAFLKDANISQFKYFKLSWKTNFKNKKYTTRLKIFLLKPIKLVADSLVGTQKTLLKFLFILLRNTKTAP